jgi:hypothetical protein
LRKVVEERSNDVASAQQDSFVKRGLAVDISITRIQPATNQVMRLIENDNAVIEINIHQFPCGSVN